MTQELLAPAPLDAHRAAITAEIAELAADLFSVTTTEVVSASSFVDDLGSDSLLAIELLAQLEKRYAITIPESELPRMSNLAGTYAVAAESAGW